MYLKLYHEVYGKIDDLPTMERWNKRRLPLESPTITKATLIRNNKALFLTPTNQEKAKIIAQYLRTAQNVVHYACKADGRLAGSANPNKNKAGMMTRIPLHNYFFKQMMIKLTMNLDVQSGLSNGARGTVVDLYFDSKDVLEYILVDMPTYKGPRLHADLPATYCLVGKVKVYCSDFKNSRVGFPLSNGKVDTIHSSQGITAGEGEEVEFIVLHQWNKKWENRWPGCFYVAVSRVTGEDKVFFSSSLDQASLRNIGKTKAFKIIHEEEQRLKETALQNRRNDLNGGVGTKEDFKNLLKQFLDLVQQRHHEHPRNRHSAAILDAAGKWYAQLNAIGSESRS